MNRDTIAYRKFIGWWWPLEAPLQEELPVDEGASPQCPERKAGQWGIGSPYLRLWMLLGAIAASAVFMGWDGRVVSAPIGGGTLTPLVTGLNGPYGIAVA